MTEDEREALIEEAAKAILVAAECPKEHWLFVMDSARRDAEAALDVFERAAQAEIQEAVAERDELRTKAEAPPVYLALDLWMALGLDSRGFDGYYDRNGWADTWATLLDAVRRETGSRPSCTQITDGEVCELIAGHLGPHMGASDVGSSEPLPAAEPRLVGDVRRAVNLALGFVPWPVTGVEYDTSQMIDALVRELSEPRPRVTDEMVDRALNASRDFPRTRGLDNPRNVMRAALEAALGGES